jgi:hypothetical protein
MTKSSPTSDPPLGVAVTSVVLGAVGSLLFFLPILSIPLGAIGAVLGLTGIVLAIRGGWTSLRWSIVGLVVSAAAMGMGVNIAQAPAGYLRSRAIPLNARPVPEQPYVPPPAPPLA